MNASPTAQPITGVTFPNLWSLVNPAQAISVIFFVLFVIWAFYSLITAYHLLRYGHKSAVTIPALITHVLVSAYLAIFAVSGLHI